MTTWAWYAAGLMTALALLALLICIYALIISGTTSQDHDLRLPVLRRQACLGPGRQAGRGTGEMKDGITTIRIALTSAKNIALAHRRGGLHKLWPQLKEALQALDRIENQSTTTQMPLFAQPPADSADYKRDA